MEGIRTFLFVHTRYKVTRWHYATSLILLFGFCCSSFSSSVCELLPSDKYARSTFNLRQDKTKATKIAESYTRVYALGVRTTQTNECGKTIILQTKLMPIYSLNKRIMPYYVEITENGSGWVYTKAIAQV